MTSHAGRLFRIADNKSSKAEKKQPLRGINAA
jgi:hypothetical protein